MYTQVQVVATQPAGRVFETSVLDLVLTNFPTSRPVSHSRFLPLPANSVLSHRQLTHID